MGSVPVGGDAPVSVQSMATTVTADVNATLQQIAELTAAGCQIVRVAVPSQDDADALPAIARKSQIPVIADIHFQPKYVFAAIDAGCAGVRVNPGNIKQFDDKIKEIAAAAGDAGVPIRIGVNAGSLDPRLLAKYGKATPEALVESALWELSLFEEHGFRDLKISVKHHDPVVMIQAYRLLSERCEYPLHLGVTEAGPTFQGTIKSAVAFGSLLADGIGDTIRVSLSAPPVEEVKVGIAILESLNLRQRKLEIVSCPSCGRAQVDVYTLADQVTAGLEGLDVPLRVAVMGCVVNGPGEAREADIGVASGNGKGQIFVRGQVVKTVPESRIVETLLEEAMRLAEELSADSVASGTGRGVRAVKHGPLRSGEGVAASRLLSDVDLSQVMSFLAADPLGRRARRSPGRGRRAGPSSARCRGLGFRAARRRRATALNGVCYAGANLIPVSRGGGAIQAFAERAAGQGRRCSSIVGRADAVLDLWALLVDVWGAPRELRDDQPLLSTSLPSPAAPDPRVRAVLPEEVEVVFPAAVAMFTEEVGTSPLGSDGGRAYRSRLHELVGAGRVLAIIEDGRVVFKADLAAVSAYACQIQGVWVDPERRGQGLGTAGMAAVVAAALQLAPVATLYVNSFNTAALDVYRRVGMRRVGTYASVLF